MRFKFFAITDLGVTDPQHNFVGGMLLSLGDLWIQLLCDDNANKSSDNDRFKVKYEILASYFRKM